MKQTGPSCFPLLYHSGKSAILTCLMVCCPWFLSAQDANDIQFELLDEEDGMSNHLITDIEVDRHGFLWVATKDGLNRYDGYSFKIFKNNPKDSSSLLFDYGQKLYKDKTGNLWVSYYENGLSKYIEECQCFKHYKLEYSCAPIEELSNKVFYIDHDSIVWYGNLCEGLNKYNLNTNTQENFPLPNIYKDYPLNIQSYLNSVTGMFVENDGLFWLSTRNGLYTFNPKIKKFNYKPLNRIEDLQKRLDNFLGILPDENRGFYLNSFKGGISYFNKTTQEFKTMLYDETVVEGRLTNIIQDIGKKNENEYWFSTANKGIGIYNSITGKFHFTDNKLIGSNQKATSNTRKLIQLKENVLFAVTGDGLLKYDPNQYLFNFKTLNITRSQNNENFQINSIFEDPEYHSIYFATEYGNGFNILNTNTGNLKEIEVDILNKIYKNTFVMDITEDANGILWIVSFDYIYQLDRQKMKLNRMPSSVLDPISEGIKFTFNKLHVDAINNLWLHTTNGTIHKFDYSNSKFYPPEYIQKDDTSYINYIYDVKIDHCNKFWILAKDQLGVYDPIARSYTKIELAELNDIRFDIVKGFDLDLSGNLILALDKKAIYEISTGDYIKFKIRDIGIEFGLSNFRIHSMGIDAQNNIWLSTLKGVYWLNKTDRRARCFTQSHGMSRINKYIKFNRTNTGAFYINVLNRYCKVNFNNLSQASTELKVFIDKIRILNFEQTDRIKDSTLLIKPNENFFSFDFSCIDFTNPSLNQFAYKLEGWDQEWIYSNNRRYANYTNLDGGHYTFKVKAKNQNEEWSDPVELKVYIQSPYYKSIWFTLLLGLGFVGLIYGLYLFRVRHIEREEKLKTDFNKQLSETRMQALRAQMNPHFVFNCLNSINRYIIKSDVKTSSLYLTKFAKLIRLILDNSEYQLVVLSNELEALSLYIEMEQLRFDHKFNFSFNISPEVETDHISIPPLLIQPYVENAIWHGLLHKTDPGELTIKLHQQEEQLICEIIDNGIGREQSKQYTSATARTRKSVGIKLTEERLKLYAEDISSIGQQKIIDLYDEEGIASGTKVILTIPI